MNAQPRLFERVRFGAYELNVLTGELVSLQPPSGSTLPERILLREQPFQILRILLERQGKVVTRQEIRSMLWPTDINVDFDRSINVAIAILRKALSDDADRPKYIETLARRGYRLIAPVEWQQSSTGGDSPAERAGSEAVASPPLYAGALIGKRVSRYRVLELLGGGGMGVVYKAEDLKLDRRVALKFLPEELSDEPKALLRFELEAKAASALNHPNICIIYGIEEYEHKPFIAMELLEGDTLSAQLARSPDPLPLAKILDIAIQVCDALEAAHAKGIVHRDIKPGNIFLTASGPVKILDFGLAKLTAAEEDQKTSLEAGGPPSPAAIGPDRIALTVAGTTLGTTGYMSPEQIRKEKLDPRTDLFSFGLVLYEMATGRRAFEGQTAVIIHDAILQGTPISARKLASSVPRSLEALISKALEKDRARRYQSACEIRKDLLRIQKEIDPRRRILRRSFATAIVLSFLALGGWAYLRIRNTVTLSPTDTIVFADLNNQTGDPALTDGLNTALQVALFQSPYLNLLGTDKLHETLHFLQLPEDTNVTVSPDIAHQVCQHTNSRAIISGGIMDLGNRYGIELQALDCRTGRRFVRITNNAEARDDLVRVLGWTAAQLRVKLGEPKDSLAKFNQPLELTTSSSPDALHFLASAYESHLHGDLSAAVEDYERALEKDPNLALAYAGEASAYTSEGDEPGMRTACAKAMELREHLTAPSRFQVETLCYGFALGAWDKAAAAAEQWSETFPNDVIVHVNFAGALVELGRPEEALIQAREAARLLPGEPMFQTLLQDAVYAGRLDEAKATYDEMQARHFDSSRAHDEGTVLAFLRNDPSALQAEWAWAAQHPDAGAEVMHRKAMIEAYHGQLRDSHRLMETVLASKKRLGSLEDATNYEDIEALVDAEIGDIHTSRRLLGEGLKNGVQNHDTRLYGPFILAREGDLADVEKLADAVGRDYPDDIMVQDYCLPTIRAATKLRQNNPGAAIEILRPTAQYELGNTLSLASLYPAYIRGLAYLQLKQGNLAAAEFQKLLDHPGIVGLFVTGALAHLQLARAQAMNRDYAAARKSYEDFLTLWKDADPDVPVYQEAKAEYARLPKKD
ncbi:MAG TPA: protein kinase [Candidatus Aquilonibacter sp.]|nr:protein kinase [Candidatus Aquilonibacter sp.]